jgi:cold shock CspA family protein
MFGFIAKDDGSQVFFKKSGVTCGSVCKDDVVGFDIDNCVQGTRAVNIRKI